jgi:hypothetical protein
VASTAIISKSIVKQRPIAKALGMGALGFALVAGVVHLGVRDAIHLHADIRSEKLAILEGWSGRAYSAGFGSSHMHNGFDPRTFDAAMAGTPEETRTLNRAVAGGSQSEQRAMALEFMHQLKTPTGTEARACWVILELGAGANFTNDHLVHPRAINLYDWPTMRFVLGLASADMGWWQRVGRAGYALAAMGLHYLNVGMLSNRIFPAPLDAEMLREETVEDRRGLLVMPRQTPSLASIAAQIAAAPRQANVVKGALAPGNAELVEELSAASSVPHLQFAYVVMPKIGDLWEQVEYPAFVETTQGRVPIVNLARPQRYPQIYDPQLWYDDAHVNERGAQLVTRLLAEELKQWYAAHGLVAGCGR